MTINIKESVKREVAEWKENGVEVVLYGLTPNSNRETILVYEIPVDVFAELDIFDLDTKKMEVAKVRTRGSQKVWDICSKFPVVATLDRVKTVAESKKTNLNVGEYVEMLLTDKTAYETKRNNVRCSSDGIYNKKNVQIKVSVTSWKDLGNGKFKNNSTSTVTVVPHSRCVIE